MHTLLIYSYLFINYIREGIMMEIKIYINIEKQHTLDIKNKSSV